MLDYLLLTGWKLNIVDENNEKQGSDSNVSLLEKMQKSKEEENSQSMEVKEEETQIYLIVPLLRQSQKIVQSKTLKLKKEVKVSTEKKKLRKRRSAKRIIIKGKYCESTRNCKSTKHRKQRTYHISFPKWYSVKTPSHKLDPGTSTSHAYVQRKRKTRTRR